MTGEKALNYMLAFAAGFIFCFMTVPAEASIVNDPVALELKLEEMRVARMAKHEAKEAYWAAYRDLPEVAVVRQKCSKVYTLQGNYRKCVDKVVYEKQGADALVYPR